ncbi:MAG: hypothetical protein ACE5EA_04280 [Nitrospirota bacterium]
MKKKKWKVTISRLGLVRLLIAGLLLLPLLTITTHKATGEIVTSCVSATNCPPEDVRNSKHNFAANPDIQMTGTNEICIFCHTPHGGNTSSIGGGPPGTAPLWNRLLPSNTTGTGGHYQIYSSPNFDGAGTDPGRPKGVSLACLSCHDGSIALDSLINAQRSGGFRKGNKGISGTGGAAALPGDRVGFTFAGLAMVDSNVAGTLDDNLRTDSGKTGMGTITGGAAPFPNLTTDLRDDHPIGMEIPATDPQFSALTSGGGSEKVGGGTKTSSIWRLFGRQADGTPQTKMDDIRDQIRAYPSDTDWGKMYIECASCHNPHTPRPMFLRRPKLPGTDIPADPTNPNEQSAICLTCHQK